MTTDNHSPGEASTLPTLDGTRDLSQDELVRALWALLVRADADKLPDEWGAARDALAARYGLPL